MAERGAHAALVVTPAFFKSRMNAEAMLRHYTHVSKIQIRNYFKNVSLIYFLPQLQVAS